MPVSSDPRSGVRRRALWAILAILSTIILVVLARQVPHQGVCDVTTSPTDNLEAFIKGLSPGNVGCLRGGIYQEVDRQVLLDDRADGGTPNDPIIIQNYRGEKVEFRGGFKILDEVTDITFREAGSGEFYLDGSYALQIPDNDSPYLGTEPVVWVFGDRIRLEGLDMAKPQGWTNPNKAGTCVLMSPDRSVNSRPEDIKIIGNDIHHCGSGLPAPDSHGIYLAGINGAEIRDNLIWHNGENGIKFYPDSYKVVMEDNILYKNGRQIIWAGTGSSYPDNNVVRNNVIAFPGRSWNVYSYWRNMTTSARPKNNVVENNCLYTNLDYGAPDGLKRPTEGWTERNNVAANPKFIGNPPNGDFRMAADSPCHSVYSGRTQ